MPKLTYALLAALLWCVPALATETNLLKNATFADLDARGIPAQWRVSGEAVTVAPAALPGGEVPVAAIKVGEASASLGEFLQRVAIKPGWFYRVQTQLKSDTPGLAQVQIKLYRGKQEVKRFYVGPKSTTEWATIREEFVTPRDVDTVEVLFRYDRTEKSRGKAFYVADPQLVPLREKTYVAPRPTRVDTVATFESIGVSVAYEGDASPQAAAAVRYRAKGETAWKRGLILDHRPAESLFRGSILGVMPDTEYEIECDLTDPAFDPAKPATSPLTTVRTWPENVPIARTVRLPAGVSKQPIVINDKGTPNGWILYTTDAASPSTVDVGTDAPAAVEIKDAAYVIVENLTLRGGTVRGVSIENANHIRIRHCDIAGWGDPGTPRDDLKQGRYVNADGKVIDWQAGVHVGGGSSQVVVEGNFIHSPRGTANSWAYGHPSGPQAVILAMTAGNNVVRNNELIGNEQHWWNDAIESLFNERVAGGPYRDTDIYGNVIAFANDDGTELDGGQINVRFFNNWVQWAYCGISCAPNMGGPSYVYRNLFVLTGEQRGLTNFGFKMGGDRHPNPGRSYLLHNTMISNNLGLSTGHMGTGASPITARNNAYLAGEIFLRGTIAGNYDLDYDLIQPGVLSPPDAEGQERHATVGTPTFVAPTAGDYRLAAGSKGIDAGVRLPGVNDDFTGSAPDLGAFETGSDAVFPRRSTKMSALPLMVHLTHTPGGGSTSAEIELTVPKDLGTTWTATPNADWLRCDPAAGPTGDSPQRITLSAVPGEFEIRRHRAAVTFRTNAGHCRTVLVSLEALPAEPFVTQIEAEAGQLDGGFVAVRDPAASGGVFLQTPADYKQDQGGGVTFTFEVPADGVYYVAGLLRVPGPTAMNHDSFFVSMDGQPKEPWHLQHLGSPQFHWVNVASIKREEVALPFRLTKGTHKLTIHPRETLASLDAVRISNAPFELPEK